MAAVRVANGNSEQYRQVERKIAAAIEKNPKPLMLHCLLGMLYEADDRGEDAVKEYRLVLSLDPRHTVTLNNLACLLAIKENKVAEALELINRAIEIAGPDSEFLDSRCLIQLRGGQIALALHDIEQAITQSGAPSKSQLYRLAQTQLANKNRPAAQAALRKAKQLGLTVTDIARIERSDFEKTVAELE